MVQWDIPAERPGAPPGDSVALGVGVKGHEAECRGQDAELGALPGVEVGSGSAVKGFSRALGS